MICLVREQMMQVKSCVQERHCFNFPQHRTKSILLQKQLTGIVTQSQYFLARDDLARNHVLMAAKHNLRTDLSDVLPRNGLRLYSCAFPWSKQCGENLVRNQATLSCKAEVTILQLQQSFATEVGNLVASEIGCAGTISVD